MVDTIVCMCIILIYIDFEYIVLQSDKKHEL